MATIIHFNFHLQCIIKLNCIVLRQIFSLMIYRKYETSIQIDIKCCSIHPCTIDMSNIKTESLVLSI